MARVAEINENPVPEGASPWRMRLSRQDKYCVISVRGFKGGMKAQFRVLYKDLLKGVVKLVQLTD